MVQNAKSSKVPHLFIILRVRGHTNDKLCQNPKQNDIWWNPDGMVFHNPISLSRNRCVYFPRHIVNKSVFWNVRPAERRISMVILPVCLWQSLRIGSGKLALSDQTECAGHCAFLHLKGVINFGSHMPVSHLSLFRGERFGLDILKDLIYWHLFYNHFVNSIFLNTTLAA